MTRFSWKAFINYLIPFRPCACLYVSTCKPDLTWPRPWTPTPAPSSSVKKLLISVCLFLWGQDRNILRHDIRCKRAKNPPEAFQVQQLGGVRIKFHRACNTSQDNRVLICKKAPPVVIVLLYFRGLGQIQFCFALSGDLGSSWNILCQPVQAIFFAAHNTNPYYEYKYK